MPVRAAPSSENSFGPAGDFGARGALSSSAAGTEEQARDVKVTRARKDLLMLQVGSIMGGNKTAGHPALGIVETDRTWRRRSRKPPARTMRTQRAMPPRVLQGKWWGMMP
jgi:hypothetical protein